MGRIIRLTESDLVRLVKRIIKESEEDTTSQKCSTSVKRFIDSVMNKLTNDEIGSLVSVYERLGKEGIERKVEDLMSSESISESDKGSKFKSAVHKIARINAFASVNILGLSSAVMICLGVFGGDKKIESWAESSLETFSAATLVVAVVSTIIAKLTKEKKDTSPL